MQITKRIDEKNDDKKRNFRFSKKAELCREKEEGMTFLVTFYKNGKIFSMDTYKNVKNKSKLFLGLKKMLKVLDAKNMKL